MANSYDYRFVQNFNEKCGHLIGKRLYTFTSTKSHLCYWVWVERYEHDIYAVKFHLKAHRHSKNKYNIKTGTFEPRTIIQTCINIMLDVYHENKHASFGFIGSNSEGEDTSHDFSHTEQWPFYSLGITIITTAIGIGLYRRKEIK